MYHIAGASQRRLAARVSLPATATLRSVYRSTIAMPCLLTLSALMVLPASACDAGLPANNRHHQQYISQHHRFCLAYRRLLR